MKTIEEARLVIDARVGELQETTPDQWFFLLARYQKEDAIEGAKELKIMISKKVDSVPELRGEHGYSVVD